MLKKAEILQQLEQFSKAVGKIVIVHTSLKAIGETEGGGATLLDALIEYFTKDGGLLCIPTHTWTSDIYDRRESFSCLGVLPTLAAAHPDAVRTLHPTHSLAVFGNKDKVEKFVEYEAYADSPANPKGCFGKMYENDGYVLLLGVNQTKNTFIHFVEELLKKPGRLTDYKVEKTIIHKDGRCEKRQLYWFDERIGDVSKKFYKFEAPFRYFGCIQDGKIGNAPVQLCNCRKMKEVIERIYVNNNYEELLADDLPIDENLYK